MTIFHMHYTAREVREGLQRIVDRSAPNKRANDGTNTGCIYGRIENGALVAVCIIGQFFADLGLLGLLLQSKPDFDGGYDPEFFGACTVGSDIWTTLESHGVTFDEDAKAFARYVQDAQDGGYKWSDALRYGVAVSLWDAKNEHAQTLGVDTGEHAPSPGDFFTNDVNDPEPLAPWEAELLNA